MVDRNDVNVLTFPAPWVERFQDRALAVAYPFDGTWRVAIRGGQHCTLKSNEATWAISEGKLPDNGRGTGHVASSGALTYKLPGVTNPSLTITYSATLEGKQGLGAFVAEGTNCSGTITLARLKGEEDVKFAAQLAEETERQRLAAVRKGLAVWQAEEERKRAEVEALRLGPVFRDCPDCPEMVVVPAGEFVMGSSAGKTNEMPVHTVTVSRPFAVGKFEVTRGEFAAFVEAANLKTEEGCEIRGASGWKIEPGLSWTSPGFDQTDRHPATCVSWHDASAFVKWLSETTGRLYRLLSEAEWEYAARAATTVSASSTWYHFEGDEGKLCEYANHADQNTRYSWKNKCSDGIGERTAEVGRYKPNAFGLHDMYGNVWELVQDCYYNNYAGAPSDGGPAREMRNCVRVERGGGWSTGWRDINSARRLPIEPDRRKYNTGFRVARAL